MELINNFDKVTKERQSTAELMFLEVFSGKGGLTKAMQRLGIPALQDLDILAANSFDLTCNKEYRELRKMIRAGRVGWVHFAPLVPFLVGLGAVIE